MSDIVKEFEMRYPTKSFQKKDTKIEKDLEKRIRSALEHLRKAPNRPASMAYYEEILSLPIRINELKEAKEKGKKIIGTFCNFVPLELIYACNSIPVRLCAGAYETILAAEEILPRDICPLIKSSLGFRLLGLPYFQLCDLVIVPTTCDGKKKLGEILNNFLPVWMLEVPHRKNNNAAKDFWFSEIKILKRRLEKFSKVKITKERLRQSIQKLHNRQAIFRKLYQLKKHNPTLINGRDSLLVVQASFYDDIDRWTEKTEELYEEVKQRTTNNELRTTRLLLTGAPIIWPNYKVINIIEEAGAVIVADELCSGTLALYDPVEVDEYSEFAMLKGLANRYLLPSTCPCFTECSDRIDKIGQMAKDFSVTAVIYHSLRLCQLYDIESHKVKQVLKDKNIPMLNIHTDYGQEDVEQIKTRIEAFLEMLKSRRENRE